MSEIDKESQEKIALSEKSVEILVAKLIPTSQYFEARFDALEQKFDYKIDGLQLQINQLKESQDILKKDMDKRFEQVDKRFEQMNEKLDRILERIDTKIDNGLRENRTQSMRLFTFAMTFSAISVAGMFGKVLGLF